VLSRGERVFEIRPAVGWTKGSALRWIKDRLPDPDVLVLYVGDDITDEDAFRAIADAITIKVGEASATAARYKLNGPAEVRKLLEWLDEALEHQAFAHAEVGAKEMDLEATVY
jgi:trehalose-phosphatase